MREDKIQKWATGAGMLVALLLCVVDDGVSIAAGMAGAALVLEELYARFALPGSAR